MMFKTVFNIPRANQSSPPNMSLAVPIGLPAHAKIPLVGCIDPVSKNNPVCPYTRNTRGTTHINTPPTSLAFLPKELAREKADVKVSKRG
jgi:hypothetical protein